MNSPIYARLMDEIDLFLVHPDKTIKRHAKGIKKRLEKLDAKKPYNPHNTPPR